MPIFRLTFKQNASGRVFFIFFKASSYYLWIKMKIAISARYLKEKPDGGVARFTYEVTRRIVQKNPSDEFILVFDRNYSDSLLFGSNCRGVMLEPETSGPLSCYIWHEKKLPGLFETIKPDIFLSPDGVISLRCRVPQVSVLHDISFYHRPQDLPFLTSLYWRYFTRKFANHAARIVTVSEFCRQDISSYLNIDPGKIDIAWNGVSEYFFPAGDEEKDNYRTVLSSGIPYFLFVGNFSPRKNIPAIITAWHLFKQKTRLPHRLVLAGGRLFLNRKTDRLIRSSPWRSDIILPGLIAHQDLRMLYCAAEALVFTPWFEGFGIPAAEAMRCGTPVILSPVTSLPEIGGDAALYANPADPEEICNAMIRITSEPGLRESLSVAGQTRSQKFTWDNTADCVRNAIEKVFLK